MKNTIRMTDREWSANLWSRIKALFGGLDTRVATIETANYIPSSQKGASGGVAELDSGGHVPSSQLPSYVDDVLEYSTRSAFPETGEAGKIYIAIDANMPYRWTGSTYVEIASGLALGETSSTAYRGDRGKAAYDHAQAHGSAFASGLYLIQTNEEGHVIGAVAVQKSDITALGIPGQDTTYTFTDNDPTLAWGVRAKVGTTGGVDLHVTLPAKPTYTAQEVGALQYPLIATAIDITQPDNSSGQAGYSGYQIRVIDINEKTIGRIAFNALSTGRTCTSISAHNFVNGTEVYGGITIYVDKNADTYYDVDDENNFRNAIEAQQDLGFYIDAQGYVCQRISSDT